MHALTSLPDIRITDIHVTKHPVCMCHAWVSHSSGACVQVSRVSQGVHVWMYACMFPWCVGVSLHADVYRGVHMRVPILKNVSTRALAPYSRGPRHAGAIGRMSGYSEVVFLKM